MKDDLREKGLSGEEVYDRAAWRRLSSHIDPTQKWDKDEDEEEGNIGSPIDPRTSSLRSEQCLQTLSCHRATSSRHPHWRHSHHLVLKARLRDSLRPPDESG